MDRFPKILVLLGFVALLTVNGWEGFRRHYAGYSHPVGPMDAQIFLPAAESAGGTVPVLDQRRQEKGRVVVYIANHHVETMTRRLAFWNLVILGTVVGLWLVNRAFVHRRNVVKAPKPTVAKVSVACFILGIVWFGLVMFLFSGGLGSAGGASAALVVFGLMLEVPCLLLVVAGAGCAIAAYVRGERGPFPIVAALFVGGFAAWGLFECL